MRFAQFWHNSTGYIAGSIPPRFSPDHVKPIQACGDRSVIILDARHNVETSAAIARAECRKRGYIGFSLHQGESFTREKMIRNMESV